MIGRDNLNLEKLMVEINVAGKNYRVYDISEGEKKKVPRIDKMNFEIDCDGDWICQDAPVVIIVRSIN